LGASEAGIYSIASQFAACINLLAASFNQAFVLKWGRILEKADGTEQQQIVKSGRFVFLMLIAAALFSLVVSYYSFPIFFRTSYQGLFGSFAVLVFANVLLGIYQIVSCPIFIFRRNGRLSVATLTITCLHLVLMYMLTSWLGIIGALATCLFTNALLAWMAYKISQSIRPLPWISAVSRRID
jgi:O-antigen/teichoic acid export membrane protein